MKIISLDIETTGLSPERDKIIEIGAALVNLETREIEKEFETFITPGVPVPHAVTNLTGITDEDLEGAPKLADVKEELINFVGGHPIMGHNINFDLDFLNEAGVPLENERLDSMDIAHIAIPKADSYSLEIIAELLGVEETGKHRALKDVKDNIEIMFELLDIYFAKDIDITEILQKSQSPWKEVLLSTKHQAPSTKLEDKPKKTKQPTRYTLNAIRYLTELPPYQTEQLIPENPEVKTIIATENRDIHTLLEPTQYLDQQLFEELLAKPSLTAEETVFALKLIPLIQNTKYYIPNTSITLPHTSKNLWFEYCHKSYPEEVLIKAKEEKITILSHITLAQLAKNDPEFIKDTHLIIDEADEFHRNVQRPIIYAENRFPKSERLTILFGYIGIMYEKHGDKFALELKDYHLSSIEWQKIADLIEQISTEQPENTQLQFLNKIKSGGPQTRIEIFLSQDGSPNLKITPLNIGNFLEKKLWPLPAKLSLVSTAITYAGEDSPGLYLKKLLQLPEDIEVDIQNTKYEIQDTKYYPLPAPKDRSFEGQADAILLKELPELEKPVFILSNSRRTTQHLHTKLALTLKDQGIKVLAEGASGGMGKIKTIFEKDPKNTVLIGTYEFWRYLQLGTRHSPLPTLIIYRVPFPHPSTIPFVPPRDFNGFKEYALPVAALKIKKIAVTAKNIISFNNQFRI